MDPLEKQLMDISGDAPAVPPTPTTTGTPDAAVAPAAPTPAPSPFSDENYHPEHHGHIAPIRTFSSDLAEAVRTKGGSVVRVAIAEEEKHRREYEESSIRSKKNIAFTIFGTIVILGAIGFVGWTYTQKKAAETAPVAATDVAPPSIIPSDSSQTINAAGMQIPEMIGAVQAIVTDPNVQAGTLKNIIISDGSQGTDRQMSVTKFLTALGTHAPTSLTQTLLPDFMTGAYFYDQGNLFLIIHSTAHDFLLAGMFDWEPYLFNDMIQLFHIDTSSFTKAQLQSVPFVDTVIANRDTRAILDSNKKPLFFYSFLDANTIIFATDPKTLAEVVHRF